MANDDDAVYRKEEECLLTICTHIELVTQPQKNQSTVQGQEFDEDKLTEQVEETLKARMVLEWLGENNNVVMVAPAKAQ